jgi:hypothetical protein
MTAFYSVANLGVVIPLVLMCLALTGCSKRNTSLDEISRITQPLIASKETFLAITNGSAFEMVTNALKDGIFHEFTASEPDGEYMVLGCRTSDDFPDFWLLFLNNKLSKIIGPVAPEMEFYPYQGTTASRVKSWDIGDTIRIRKTLNSQVPTREQILSVLSTTDRQNITDARSVGDLVGGVIWASKMRNFNEAMALRVEKDYKINEELLKRYDGCRVKIGMDAKEVAKVYGEPLRMFPTKTEGLVRIFGDERSLEVSPKFLFSCVAVVFDSGERVTAVYSHDFFNDDWKSPKAAGNK